MCYDFLIEPPCESTFWNKRVQQVKEKQGLTCPEGANYADLSPGQTRLQVLLKAKETSNTKSSPQGKFGKKIKSFNYKLKII